MRNIRSLEARNARCPKRNDHIKKSEGAESPGTGINTPRHTRPDKRRASIPRWLYAMDSCVPGCSACYRRASHLPRPLPRGGCSQSTTSDSVHVPLCDGASWQSRKPWLHGSAVLSVVAATHGTPAWIVSPRGFLHLISPVFLFVLGLSRHTALSPTPVYSPNAGSSLRPPYPC